jgi:hypothetical protein
MAFILFILTVKLLLCTSQCTDLQKKKILEQLSRHWARGWATTNSRNMRVLQVCAPLGAQKRQKNTFLVHKISEFGDLSDVCARFTGFGGFHRFSRPLELGILDFL